MTTPDQGILIWYFETSFIGVMLEASIVPCSESKKRRFLCAFVEIAPVSREFNSGILFVIVILLDSFNLCLVVLQRSFVIRFAVPRCVCSLLGNVLPPHYFIAPMWSRAIDFLCQLSSCKPGNWMCERGNIRDRQTSIDRSHCSLSSHRHYWMHVLFDRSGRKCAGVINPHTRHTEHQTQNNETAFVSI